MKKILLVIAVLVTAAVAQESVTWRVSTFAGSYIESKLTAAQSACTAINPTPCYLILDVMLPKFPNESLPAPCANCIWIDERVQHVVPWGAVADEPSVFPPEVHGHDASEITNLPGGEGASLPAGLIVISLAACPVGFAEETSLAGRFVLGTLNANGDVTGTGGSDAITEVINHNHAVNVTDPGHTHVETNNSATTGSLAGFAARDTSTNTQTATGYSTQSATTGITATTANPAGGVTSIDNRPAFVKVIFCKKS